MTTRSAIYGSVLILSLVVGGGRAASPEGTNGTSLFALPLEELMDTRVVIGSVTGTRLSKAPASVTTITREMIVASTARNVADLLEIYVPGTLWLNHLAPRIGIRGIAIDRNYKVLLLVNGRNINQKGSQGATLELQNWELNDIERIEVVRGPGSVTYGPGAVAGVINIVTRTGASARGVGAGATYFSRYDSRGGYGSYGYAEGPWEIFAYASVTRTDGADADVFHIDGTTGEGRYYTRDDGIFAYEGDNMGREQLKAHLDIKYDDWRFWTRFTRSGWPCDGLEYSPRLVEAAGARVPARFASQEGYVMSLERHQVFNDRFAVDLMASYDAEHYTDSLIVDAAKRYDQDPYQGQPPGNAVYDFVESEILLGLTGHYTPADQSRFALGYNVSLDMYDKGDSDRMYMNFKSFRTADGRRVQAVLDDGFNRLTHSVFGEANLNFHPMATVMLSGRVDKHDDSDYLYSPRVAWVAELNERNILKLLWQRSVRMSTAEEMVQEGLNGRTGDSEKLMGYELIYGTRPTRNTTVNMSVYYNELDAIGWLGDKTGTIGTLKDVGAELEGRYQGRVLTAGASHAWTKELEWDSAEGITKQGISTADYNVNGLTGVGNDLSNWPGQMSKLYLTARLPRRVTAHVDTQVFWRWGGNANYITMYNRRYGSANATWNALASTLEEEDYAEADMRVNASVAWRPSRHSNSRVTLFALNLLGARRYGYSSGVSGDYPRKIDWVEEPAVFGVRFDYRF